MYAAIFNALSKIVEEDQAAYGHIREGRASLMKALSLQNKAEEKRAWVKSQIEALEQQQKQGGSLAEALGVKDEDQAFQLFADLKQNLLNQEVYATLPESAGGHLDPRGMSFLQACLPEESVGEDVIGGLGGVQSASHHPQAYSAEDFKRPGMQPKIYDRKELEEMAKDRGALRDLGLEIVGPGIISQSNAVIIFRILRVQGTSKDLRFPPKRNKRT